MFILYIITSNIISIQRVSDTNNASSHTQKEAIIQDDWCMIFDIMYISDTIRLNKQAFILHFCPNSFKYSLWKTASHFSPFKSAITSMPQSYLSCFHLGWQNLSVIFTRATLKIIVHLFDSLSTVHKPFNPICNTKSQDFEIIKVIPLHVPLSFDSGSIVKV